MSSAIQMTTPKYLSWHRMYPGRYDKFDRKTFDPANNGLHRAILERLRVQGHRRRWWYGGRANPWAQHNPNHHGCCASVSLSAVGLPTGKGVYLDLGCGDSADAIVASWWGYKGIGVDLFPPSDRQVKPHDFAPFIRADVAETLPFADGSIVAASSHAMIDLIEPDARPRFYSEVFRVLRPGSRFALTCQRLVNGYGVKQSVEKRHALAAGFQFMQPYRGSLLFKKRDDTRA